MILILYVYDMKMKLTPSKIINIIIGTVIVVILIGYSTIFMMRSNVFSYGTSSIIKTRTTLPPIDPEVSERLPHYEFKHLSDSILNARKDKDGMSMIAMWHMGPIGTQKTVRCQNCQWMKTYKQQQKNTQKEYFIRLEWWELDPGDISDPNKYYVENGQSYLRKNICKEVQMKNPQKTPKIECTEIDIPVSFRYDTETKTVMIPVNVTTTRITAPMMIFLGVLFLIYFLYVIMGNFIKFLVDIARGEPFSEANIRRLKQITLSLFYIPMILFGFNLLLALIFYKHFSSDIRLSSSALAVLWKSAPFYLTSAALYAAFKKGKQLKEDTDLTV